MPKPQDYPGDEYIKNLVLSMGVVIKDANANTIIGKDVSIDSQSMGNIIVADNATVRNSHNNVLNAKNVVIEMASGCRIDGADHTIKGNGTSANYACIDGDANWSEGYAARTSGFGNVNCGEYCAIDGHNNRIGSKGQPNKFRDSSIHGSLCEIDGSNSHATGYGIKIKGDGITVVGDNTAGAVFTVPGVYILNQK